MYSNIEQKIVLITSFYKARQPARRDEYNQCLEINCAGIISEIVVFFEGTEQDATCYPALQHDKVKVIYIDKRPMYSLFIDYANNHLAGNYVVITNGDIYFDEKSNIERVREVKPNHVWALSRHRYSDVTGEWSAIEDVGSYDSYAFISPIKNVDRDYDILIGVVGCDSYLVQKMIRNGLTLSNPTLSIASRHKHNVSERNQIIRAGNQEWTYWGKPDYILNHPGLFTLLKLTWIYLIYGLEFRLPLMSHIEDSKEVSRKRFPNDFRLYRVEKVGWNVRGNIRKALGRTKKTKPGRDVS